MIATRNFTRLTLKAETTQDLKVLDMTEEQMTKAGYLSVPVIVKEKAPAKTAATPAVPKKK